MLDLKLFLYAEHSGWHEFMVLSVRHDSGDSTVGLFKTAERNPEKRPECETHSPRPFTKKSLSVATSAMGKKQRKALLKGIPSVGHTFVL